MMQQLKSINYSEAFPSASKSSTPSPIDFDHFVPWVFQSQNMPVNVIVSKIIKDGGKNCKKSSTSRSRPTSRISENTINLLSTIYKIDSHFPNSVPITSIYNNNGDLLEIVIINCPCLLQLIKVIAICLPFHLSLYKLTLKRKGVNCGNINELSKLIQYSNITDLCLDDTYVPEGNYFILIPLENLKVLSLSRCSINERVCEKIADKLGYSTTSLMVLNLSSNRISDSGVMTIGYALRKNRILLHLDISDNGITDIGINNLLNQLIEFALTSEEILEYKRYEFNDFAKKYNLHERCNKKANDSFNFDNNKENICNNIIKDDVIEERIHSLGIKKGIKNTSEIKIMYDKKELIYKNDQLFNIGNLKLCSLNIAHNNLACIALRKICNVLEYQKHILQNQTNSTGLLRIVLKGNNIPHCKELDEINQYLIQASENAAITQTKNMSYKKKNLRKKSMLGESSYESIMKNTIAVKWLMLFFLTRYHIHRFPRL